MLDMDKAMWKYRQNAIMKRGAQYSNWLKSQFGAAGAKAHLRHWQFFNEKVKGLFEAGFFKYYF